MSKARCQKAHLLIAHFLCGVKPLSPIFFTFLHNLLQNSTLNLAFSRTKIHLRLISKGVIFDSEAVMKRVLTTLSDELIFPRRYFFPALNTLPYLKHQQRCPVAEDIASRVLSLPLYAELEESTVARIIRLIQCAL
jgi:dTDP-4-amino-4,6-dideoxygalactose transaminase